MPNRRPYGEPLTGHVRFQAEYAAQRVHYEPTLGLWESMRWPHSPAVTSGKSGLGPDRNTTIGNLVGGEGKEVAEVFVKVEY